jgi:uncharacterized Fe-S cluster-containing protein
MNRETFRKLQSNTKIVINDNHSGKLVGRGGLVSKIIDKTKGVVRVHLDGNKSTNDFHYNKLDIAPESIRVAKIDTTVDEVTQPVVEEEKADEDKVEENEQSKPETETAG